MVKAILLVEDSPDDVEMFVHVMRKSGLHNPVLVVQDGVEAIAYLKGEKEFADREKYPMPVVLMLDLKMPRVDGFEVLEWLQFQSSLKNLLVIVLTHSGQINDINRAYALGADSFLIKPFSEIDLLDLTRHFDGRWIKSPTSAD